MHDTIETEENAAPRRSATHAHSRRRSVAYIIIILLSVPLIYLFGFAGMRFFLVPSRSMEPALNPPEYLLTLKQDVYTRGEIIVLRDPIEAGGYLVKRIVGTPGDRVSVSGGGLFLNGSYASEPYLRENMDYEMDEYSVADGEVFVLGDNRNESADSHDWLADSEVEQEPSVKGVPIASIVGRVRCVYLPLKQMRPVHPYPLKNTRSE